METLRHHLSTRPRLDLAPLFVFLRASLPVEARRGRWLERSCVQRCGRRPYAASSRFQERWMSAACSHSRRRAWSQGNPRGTSARLFSPCCRSLVDSNLRKPQTSRSSRQHKPASFKKTESDKKQIQSAQQQGGP